MTSTRQSPAGMRLGAATADRAGRTATRSRLGDRLLVTIRARGALRDLVIEAGEQHILLSWPAGTTTLPARLHEPSAHDVIVGHVARCPIYVDLRQLHLFRDRIVLVDVPRPPRDGRRPVFHVQAGRGRPLPSRWE